jgi:hypothetical protein
MLDVASTQSAELLKSTIEPAVDGTRRFLEEQRSFLRHEIDALTKEFEQELDFLRAQAELWEEVERIQMLQDQSISGEYRAFEQLSEYASADERLARRANVSALQVKTTFLGASRKGTELRRIDENGRVLAEKELSTSQLLAILRSTYEDRFGSRTETPWDRRARAAYALGHLQKHRKCSEVPGLLVRTANDDPSLWVRHEALQAFFIHMSNADDAVTDVFGWDRAASWWEEHGTDELKRQEYTACLGHSDPSRAPTQ